MTPPPRRSSPACRFGRGAALGSALAALTGSTLYVQSLYVQSPWRPKQDDLGPHGGRLELASAGPLIEPVPRSDLWSKPKPWCLDCHRQGDRRIDPSRRTAYAAYTEGSALGAWGAAPPACASAPSAAGDAAGRARPR